jgi:Domain of unknown function (DUF397)
MNGTDPRWRKSTYSGSNGGGCVEAGNGDHAVLVRDTTDRDGGMLAFSATAWNAFTATVKTSLTDPLPRL